MIAVAAISRDRFMARGPDDDLKWTGSLDKTLFRLLSHTHPTLIMGSRTAKVAPKHFRGRRTLVVSRRDPDLTSMEALLSGLILSGEELARCTLAGGPGLLDYGLQTGTVERLFTITVPVYLREGLSLPGVPANYHSVDQFSVPAHDDQQLLIDVYERT